jgi:hypothetical protein
MRLFDLQVVCICLVFLIPSTCSLPWKVEPVKHHEQRNWEQRNYDTIRNIYNLTVYPNQLPILQKGAAGVPAGLFSEKATGRVDPVGNFSGFEDSIEYFFALAPVPSANAASTAISRIQITEFSSACPDVAASVVYLFCNVEDQSANNGKALAPLKEVSDRNQTSAHAHDHPINKALAFQVAFWKFDRHGAVLKYDAWIPNLNDWIVAGLGIQINNPQVAAQSIQQLCGGTQQRCTGENKQWDSVEECIATLSGKPYGNYDEAWGDNIVCRTIHLVLTQVRPQVSLIPNKCESRDQIRILNCCHTDPLPSRWTHWRRQMCGLRISAAIFHR